jgi:hypothetical protein
MGDLKTVEECINCIKSGNNNGCHLKHVLKNLIERVEALENQ